jgi:NAD(P)-dependent dehydrogenase (short-subunit alcohol dehydrogenase family)
VDSTKVAVVTGASRGIGRAVAERLAADGWLVAAVARSVSEERDGSGRILWLRVDVVDERAVRSSIDRVEHELGPIDLLVNNAGISGEHTSTWQQTTEQWWNVFEVNVRGAMHCCHAVLPGMIERRAGRIVNVASNAAFFQIDAEMSALMSSAYMASKAALVRFTEALARETDGTGVAVVCVSPGMVKTDMTASHFPQDWFDDESIWTPAERTAELIEHIASGELDGLSGRYIHVASDDWATMAQRAADINERDLHAMRIRLDEKAE